MSERRERAFEKLGNILGFVAAYILGPAPEQRGVPTELVSAIRELRRTYTTHRADMDADLVTQLASSITCARGWPSRELMFTVSLAADAMRTVELFGKEAMPALRTGGS